MLQVFGLVLGILFGVFVIKIAWLFLPLVVLAFVVIVYLVISLLEELLGRQLVTTLGGRHVQLRFASLLSSLSVGLVTFLVLWALNSWFGIVENQYQYSHDSASGAIDAYFDSIGKDVSVIETKISATGLAAYFVLVVSLIWAVFVYIGGNYWVSRSISYCIHAFVLAFFIDVVATLVFFALTSEQEASANSFVLAVNQLDATLRSVAMIPVKWLVAIFADYSDLIDAVTRIYGTFTDIAYTLLDIGLRIVTINLDGLRESIGLLVDFARLLRVDFLSFLLASAVLFARLSWSRYNEDHRLQSAP